MNVITCQDDIKDQKLVRSTSYAVACVECQASYTLVAHRVISNLKVNSGKIVCRSCMALSRTGHTAKVIVEKVYVGTDVEGLPTKSTLKVQVRCSKCDSVYSLTTANAKANVRKNGNIVCRNCILGTEDVRKKQSARRFKVAVTEWVGFYQDDYDSRWTAKLRKMIRKRDGVCILCGAVRADNFNRALTVHHVDWNKQNSVPDNLVALCCTCHNAVHNAGVKSTEQLKIYAELTGNCKK